MGWRAFPLLLVATFATSVSAESNEEQAAALVAEGEQLGKAGKYDQALERFRRAEALHPRAVHDCYIAIALARQKSLTRARHFLDRCSKRSESQPPIEWYDDAYKLLVADMKEHGRVEFIVAADDEDVVAAARIEVRGFEDLAVRSGAALWLPAGTHRVVVRHDGYKRAKQNIEVEAGSDFKITARLVAEAPDSTVVAIPPEPAKKAPIRAYAAYGVAGAALIGAVVFHINGSMARSDAEDASTQAERDEHIDTLKVNRIGAFSLYGVAAVAATVGTVWLLQHRRAQDKDVAVSIGVAPDTAMVVLGGRFD